MTRRREEYSATKTTKKSKKVAEFYIEIGKLPNGVDWEMLRASTISSYSISFMCSLWLNPS